MALGGFKSGEFMFSISTSTTASVVGDNVKGLVSGVCALLMSLEPHWGYDANYTATASDFVKIHATTSYEYQAYAQFLVNSSTGSKLMVFYNPGGYHLINADCCCNTSDSSYYSDIGLGMSMIPGGSSNTWDISSNCTTNALVPYDGVRCISTANRAQITSYTNTFVHTGVTNGKYYLIVKEDLICVFSGASGVESLYSGFAIGKIFGQLFNSADNAYYSKYGAFNFESNGEIKETAATAATTWIDTIASSPYWGTTVVGCLFRSTVTTHAITRDSSTIIRIAGCIPYTNDGTCINPSSTNATAFTAILIGVTTNDSQTYGVVPGNGYKGWLDTDFIRGIYYGLPYNTSLVGGKFIHLGGGLAIGWDPSNTVVLRS